MPRGHTYIKNVSNTGLYRPTLDIDIYSNIYDPPEQIYSMTVTYLAPNELGLNDGRFLHFSYDEQAIVLHYEFSSSLKDWFEERVTWIASNVHNAWSFDLNMPHVSLCRFRWSFADVNDAMLFKLTF